jgi:hypothetical protein
MSDEPTTNPPIPPLAEIGSAVAPIIYFDAAPNFGFNNGICSIALEVFTYVNIGGVIRAERRVVTHLRMTPSGLASLKGSIQGIELSLIPAEGAAN